MGAIEAGKVVAVGRMEGDRFVVENVGYWRCIQHRDGRVMVSLAPMDDDPPLTVIASPGETAAGLLRSLRSAGTAITRALFGDP